MVAFAMAMAMVGCEYDDSGILGRLDALEERVLTLEQLCQQTNTNISSLQSLVDAVQQRDYITSITPIKQGDTSIGYTITFAKGEPITIYGSADPSIPTIGVDVAEDGKYYWTLYGEWITDKDGNKIPTSGGAMPELKMTGGYWCVSYDGGKTWERTGRATGLDGQNGQNGQNGEKGDKGDKGDQGDKGDKGDKGDDGDSFFQEVNIEEDFVEFILSDGTVIIVARDVEFEAEVALRRAIANGGNIVLCQDVVLRKKLFVEAGNDVTLDLNGYTLTISSGCVIENKGELTIKGDYGAMYSEDTSDAVKNSGTLSIEGGAFDFDPSAYIPTTGYQCVVIDGMWHVILQNSSVVICSYDTTKSAKDNGKTLSDLIKGASQDQIIYLEPGVYGFTDGYSRFSDKSLTLIGLGEGVVIEGDKYTMVIDGTTAGYEVTLKNLTLKGGKVTSWAHCLYAKKWSAVNLYDVVCTNPGGGAILLDRSNLIDGQYIDGVTTTVNAYKGVKVDNGDAVELNANPCTATSLKDGYNNIVTYARFNYTDGTFTCRPQNATRSTGSNLFVNGEALPAYN